MPASLASSESGQNSAGKPLGDHKVGHAPGRVVLQQRPTVSHETNVSVAALGGLHRVGLRLVPEPRPDGESPAGAGRSGPACRVSRRPGDISDDFLYVNKWTHIVVTCRMGAKTGPVSRIYIGEAVLVHDVVSGT